MRCWTKPELSSNGESNRTAKSYSEFLDFNDRSWIVDHHRHNLILKILKPENFSFGAFRYFRFKAAKPQDSAGAGDPERQIDGTQTSAGDNQSEGSEQSYVISFAELQCIRLRQLQRKLIHHAIDLRYEPGEPLGWVNDLREYVQALQDYDYMQQKVQLPHDPFTVNGEQIIERHMLRVAMKGKEIALDPLREAKAFGEWETGAGLRDPIGGIRYKNILQARTKGFEKRLGVAAIGGIFLIGPMWLMVLHDTLYTALISTSVFVAVFGVIMAFFLDKLMDVMSSTAAYAAVLVVFVGLSTSQTS